MSNNIIYISFVALLMALSVFTDSFLTTRNLINVLRQATVVGVLSLGMTFVMIAGGIDLSVGSTMALAACVSSACCTFMHLPVLLSVVVGCVVGAVVGLINGIIIAYMGIVAFIATLGMQYAVRGIALVYTGGRPISSLPKEYTDIGKGYIGFIPIPVVIFFVAAFIAWFVLSKTKYGRYIYAIGGNESAALVSGLNVKRHKMMAYEINGITAALAGIILSARVAVGGPTAGESYGLLAITAVIVGGTSSLGGTGGIIPTIIGVFIVTVVNNGMDLMGISGYYQKIVTGVVVLIAVLIDRNNVNRNH